MIEANSIKLSIIIACLNSKNNIDKAIKSLQKQNCNNVEIIFVDGGSTDNTVEIIRNYEITNCIIISEPDRGISDAWNKGLRVCTGDVIGILNSDDYLEENMLSKILDCFVDLTVPLIGFGDVTLIDYNNVRIKTIKGKMCGKLALLNGFGFLHPSVYFNRKALEVNGLFNTRINVSGDVDWLLRAITNKIAFRKIPSHTYMQVGGLSNVSKYTGMGEYMDSLVRNGYSEFHILIFLIFRVIGHTIKFILGPKHGRAEK